MDLPEDENVLCRRRLSLWCLGKQIAAGIVLAPIGGAIFAYTWGSSREVALVVALTCISSSIGLLLWVYAKWNSVEVVLTERRVTWSVGIVTVGVVNMLLDKIETVDAVLGPWGRMLGFGTLQIIGTGSTHEPIVGLRDPRGFYKAVMQAQAKTGAGARGAVQTPAAVAVSA